MPETPPADAQPRSRIPGEPEAPPVEEFVRRALARAPSLEARRARLEAARAEVEPAAALPDPMLEFEYRAADFPRYTIGRDPMSMAGAMLRQGLETRGRRQARRSVALAVVEERRAEAENAAANLVTAVREQYARLYELDHEEATLADAREIADLLAATAANRYAAGATDQAAVLRAQAEHTRLGERLADVRAARQLAVAALNRLTDDPPAAPVGRVWVLPDLPRPAPVAAVTAAEEQAGRTAPLVGLREAEVAVARREVDVARQDLRTSFSVGAGLFWQGNTDRMAVFTVGLELPFWKERKQRPRVVAAERALEAAELESRAAAAEARAEASALLIAWRQADEQAERYRTAILPQTSAVLDATRASYLGGRSEFSAVAQEFRRWIEVRVELARREAAGFSARAALDVLLSPPDLPAGPGQRAEGTGSAFGGGER